MNKILTITCLALLSVLLLPGCSVKKIEYEKEGKKISYRIYENEHWLKTESTGLKGGMTKDGDFEFAADGMKSSPSEEFNRTMQTYTTAFIQLAQIAAAAYNPSASAALQNVSAKQQSAAATPAATATTPAISEQEASASAAATPAATTNATECADCIDGTAK